MKHLKQVCQVTILIQLVVLVLFWHMTFSSFPWLIASGNMLGMDLGAIAMCMPRRETKGQTLMSAAVLVLTVAASFLFVYAVLAATW